MNNYDLNWKEAKKFVVSVSKIQSTFPESNKKFCDELKKVADIMIIRKYEGNLWITYQAEHYLKCLKLDRKKTSQKSNRIMKIIKELKE